MDQSEITVLHVDADETTRDAVDSQIKTVADMSVLMTDTVAEATAIASSTQVDCVVSEYELPDGTAFDLFDVVRDHSPDAACILYTRAGFEDIETGESTGAVVEFLSKGIPGTVERLPELVEDVVSDRNQVGYPVPDDEAERLDAIDEYDQAYAEELFGELTSGHSFERITKLVRSRFGVDVAFLGIIRAHEEQMVSCQGAQWSMLDRENSICAYSMLEEDVTVIPDTDADPRFEHNQRLKELGVRSYAGANLTTPAGHVIGQLCVTDSSPRTYDFEERRDLQLFAEEIMEQFELRRRLPPEDATMTVGEKT